MTRTLVSFLAAASLLVSVRRGVAEAPAQAPSFRLTESLGWTGRMVYRVRASVPVPEGDLPPSVSIRVLALDLDLPLTGGRGSARIREGSLRIRAVARATGGTLRVQVDGIARDWTGSVVSDKNADQDGIPGPRFDVETAEVSVGETVVPFAVGITGWATYFAGNEERYRFTFDGEGLTRGSDRPFLLLARRPAGKPWLGRVAGVAGALGTAPPLAVSVDGGAPVAIEPLKSLEVLAGGTPVTISFLDAAVPSSPGMHGVVVRAGPPGASTAETLPIETPAVDPPSRLSMGLWHFLEIRKDGRLWTWGFNVDGELGDGTTTFPAGPQPVPGIPAVRSVAAGYGFSLAVDREGGTWLWGDMGAGPRRHLVPVRFEGLPPARSVAAGDDHALLLLRDGTVRALGRNGSGELGDGTGEDSRRWVRVPGLEGVAAIAAGSSCSMALREDGSVWAWGETYLDGVGDGRTPARVPGLPPCKAIAAELHSIALDLAGGAWTWGRDIHGFALLGRNTYRPQPERVTGLPPVRSVAAGIDWYLAVDFDGHVWAWGTNDSGQLGDRTVEERPVPVRVPDLGPIAFVATGGWLSMAVGEDGAVWSWGETMVSRWSMVTERGGGNLPILDPRVNPRGAVR